MPSKECDGCASQNTHDVRVSCFIIKIGIRDREGGKQEGRKTVPCPDFGLCLFVTFYFDIISNWLK